jgi:hypothetical protein
MPAMPRSRSALTFAIVNALLAIALLGGVFGALPTRFWAVDIPSAGLAALLLVSAIGVSTQRSWGRAALRISALCALAIGLATLAALALSASYLGGIHGELGRNGLIACIVGACLLGPYLIIYPALQLLWLHAQEAR